MPRVIPVLILALLLIPGLATDAAADGYGAHVWRVRLPAQTMHDEEVIVGVIAFRSSLAHKPMAEPIHIMIHIQRLINNTRVGAPIMRYNGTHTGSTQRIECGIGRPGQGTWEVDVRIRFVDGVTLGGPYNMLVTHRPTPYSLFWLDGGQRVQVASRTRNRTLDVEIWGNYGDRAELLHAESGVEKMDYRIDRTAGMLSAHVRITDQWNWTNMGDGVEHTWYYTRHPAADSWRYAIIFMIVAAAAAMCVGIWVWGRRDAA